MNGWNNEMFNSKSMGFPLAIMVVEITSNSAKRPFADPEAVLAYLSRYTHRVAIANSRLREFNEQYVTFTYKDHRLKGHAK